MADPIAPRTGRRLLFVSKGGDSSSTRYRALQYFPLWQAAGFEPLHVTASGGSRATLDMLRQASRADVVVVLRKTFARPLLWLLRRAARRLVFDFDDAVFCNTDGTSSRTRMARFAAMARACDHIFARHMPMRDLGRVKVACPACGSTKVERVFTPFYAKTIRKS